MSHFAKLDVNNRVVYVTVGRDEDDGLEDELSARTGDVYKQTSYNTRGGVYYDPETGEPAEDQSKAFRKNFAGIGYTYDEERDAFIPPKHWDSWVLDEDSCTWVAPVEAPPYSETERYYWDERNLAWVLETLPE